MPLPVVSKDAIAAVLKEIESNTQFDNDAWLAEQENLANLVLGLAPSMDHAGPHSFKMGAILVYKLLKWEADRRPRGPADAKRETKPC